MGFFDLFAAKKQKANTPPGSVPLNPQALSPAQEPAAVNPPAGSPPSEMPPVGGSLKSRLLQAREQLEARNLAGALAIYDEIFSHSGDRADVLVTVSGDLGATGYIDTIIELVAPRYDAQRHGPAAGLNLLQAYLVARQPGPAQHLLDILFSLRRPELEQRLYGFSNALAELIAAQNRGEMLPGTAVAPSETGAPPAPAQGPKTVSLASISKPIWAYGIEEVKGILPAAKAGKLRRVAFAQLAVIDPANPKIDGAETDLTRFARGFALWLAETFYYSPHYAPLAAIGLIGQERLANFPTEWSKDNLRQLVSTTADGLDYIVTGAIRRQNDASEITLRVWEVKKMRERKVFTAAWVGENANAELLRIHEQVRLFMEWQNHPGGPDYQVPRDALGWCDSLGLSLSLFLADKGVIPADQVPVPHETGARLAVRAAESEHHALAWYTAVDRARRLGIAAQFPAAASPAPGPLAEEGRLALGL